MKDYIPKLVEFIKKEVTEEINDCLVIGTDNKSENYIGYFTKFGEDNG